MSSTARHDGDSARSVDGDERVAEVARMLSGDAGRGVGRGYTRPTCSVTACAFRSDRLRRNRSVWLAVKKMTRRRPRRASSGWR